MVKPLYIKVSQKYAKELRFSGQLKMPPPPQKPTSEEKTQTEAADASETGGSNVKGQNQKQGTLPLLAGLQVVCKHLGKSRSASLVLL
ncbi:hypothetical protein SESBI_04069 [Sesbania bispinosa]|nr:hypothetical protein SESBI_04069 [Sesbania bispinosa]